MKLLCWAICSVGFLLPGAASADELDQGLATLWEVLWHQSGTPTRVVRWENEIRVRFHGVELAPNREYTFKALTAVGNEAGIRVTDVTDQPDAVNAANLSVEITPDQSLEDNQPCVTYLNFKIETRIDSAVMQMRARDVARCAYHEAMHVMGVRGHPAGKTVLSYFPIKVDGLLPLDRVMLRAWYSQKMTAGMTPFEALPVLADELVATVPNRVAATAVRDRFLMATVEQAQAYASGQGDVPAVLKRSGKSTEEGIRFGRSEMSFFLGVAYQQGASVPQDSAMARNWLERATTMGNRRAQHRLGAIR